MLVEVCFSMMFRLLGLTAFTKKRCLAYLTGHCVFRYTFLWGLGCYNKVLWLNFTGRLYQVEYAMEAIGHAGTCLGILANDGVLLAAERRNIHKLLDEVFFSEKIYKLNEWVIWTAEILFSTHGLAYSYH